MQMKKKSTSFRRKISYEIQFFQELTSVFFELSFHTDRSLVKPFESTDVFARATSSHLFFFSSLLKRLSDE